MSFRDLYECIKNRKVNNSQAREAIYEVLLRTEDCLCVSDITRKLSEVYPRKISLNTIYRHLTLFVECGLVVVVQDDHKKAYYCLVSASAKTFELCTKCNRISTIKNTKKLSAVLSNLAKNEYITIHRKCNNCDDN